MSDEIILRQNSQAAATPPIHSGAVAAVASHANHFDLLARASDVSCRLELCALIAERCGWRRPHHSTGEKTRDVFAGMDRDRRRASRLLRGLQGIADFRREVLRLHAEGELADMGGRLQAILRPAGADLITEEFAAMIAAAPNCPASGEIYIPSTVAAISRCMPSTGALILGLNDCGKADARRFGRAPASEIEEAIEARETELEDRGAALAWLIDHAAALPGIMAQERADAEAAERRRLTEEAKAIEAARRADIWEATSWVRNGAPEHLAKFAPDILREARDLVAAEDRRESEREAHRQRQAAEYAALRAAAEAERIEKAQIADEALRVETQSLIARGSFSLAQSVGWRHFNEVADAFETAAGSNPETIAALRTFREENSACKVSPALIASLKRLTPQF